MDRNAKGVLLAAGIVVLASVGRPALADDAASNRADAVDDVSLPLVDLQSHSRHHVIVDREPGQYLGHPTTVLLEDGKTILCVYPKGHGRGGIVYKRSTDGGKSWSGRLPTPASWATSREVPTLHRVIAPDGKKRLIMWSGLYPARLAVSETDGAAWSELRAVGEWGGIVVMGFVEPLSTGDGHYLAMFHDDGRFFAEGGKRANPVVFTLYKTFSRDGGLTWSTPEAVWQGSDVHLCEPGCIRSPDGKQLAVLLRENARRKNSHIIFSNDEGANWTSPRELPLALTGDRHTGKYAADGRLFISFRNRSPRSKAKTRAFEGDWIGWVGRYEDLVSGAEGQYAVRLRDNTHAYDCAYPGVEVLPDGTFVTTTYGHWDKGESPYIRSVRFKMQDLDSIAREQYRAAAAGGGDPKAGKHVFASAQARCSDCHLVGDSARRAGPDLLGIADKYSRSAIIDSILRPSAELVAGYAVSVFVLASGDIHTGIVDRRTGAEIEYLDAEGQRRTIAAADVIDEKTTETSLMPERLHASLTTSEFADLVAYLETLHQPDLAEVAARSTPADTKHVPVPIRLEPIHDPELAFGHPVWFAPMPGQAGRALVVENDPAKIWLLERDAFGDYQKSLFVDLSADAHQGMHMGLMGLAFHPRFSENRRYFLNHHVLENGVFGTVIVERRASDDFRTDAGGPSRRVLEIPQGTILHTGGMIAFGPDAHLYIGTGDGGPQTDPEGHSQSLRSLLGSVLRIDIDKKDEGRQYAIPPSNPFFGDDDPLVRQEIWARGLRQAWRFSFDAVTHELWVGDVGQVRFEEITIVRKGENHGWNVFEGALPFSDRFRSSSAQYVPPVVAMGRKFGVSITGGYVYRGQRSPSYYGVYIFGDYESKRMWGLRQKDRKLEMIREIGRAPDRITSFAEDDDGELYLLGYDRGMVYRVVLDHSTFE